MAELNYSLLTAGLGDGGFYNIPLDVEGEPLLPAQAIDRARQQGTLGQRYATIEEANAAKAPPLPATAAAPSPAPDLPLPRRAAPELPDDLTQSAIARRTTAEDDDTLTWIRTHEAAYQRSQQKPLDGTGITGRITQEAQRQGVDPALALAVATQESSLNPDAVGDNGKSLGLFQLQVGAARDAGLDPERRGEVGNNIYGGVRYLKLKLGQARGDVDRALRFYNGGGDPDYVANVRRFLPGGAVPPDVAREAVALAGGYTSPGAPVSGRPPSLQASLMSQAQASGGTPQEIADAQRLIAHEARLQQQPQGQPFVDMGVGAVTNAQSAATGFLSAIGSAFRTPANTAEAIAPLLPMPVTDLTPQMQVLPGLSLGTLTSIWQGIGQEAQIAAQAIEIPEAQKTFANKLSEAAGTMAAYLGTRFLTGGSTLLMTGLEAFGEANQVYEALKPVVGQDEAAKRAAITAATNLLVLGMTNKLGIGGQAKTMVAKTAGGLVAEGVQEVVQYETQRRQFWVPSDHPKAEALKAHGWVEANGRVSQPFDAKTVGEILAMSSILGGSAAYIDGMVFGLHGTPAEVQAKEARVQARDALAVSRDIPASVVRDGYGTQEQPAAVPSTPELALPGSAVRGSEGAPLKVLHGTGAVFQQFAVEKQGSGEGGDLWGPGFYFAEDVDTANRYAERAATDEETVHVWEQKLRRLTAELPTAPETVPPTTDIFGEIFPTLTRSQTEAEIAEVTAKLARIHAGSSNVRPAYLDIRQPFDTTGGVDLRVLEAMIAQGMASEAIASIPYSGAEIYNLLLGELGTKADVNAWLQDLGYDGIFHHGAQDGNVWIAFRPDQVIPSFDIDAMLQMAREETAALATEPVQPPSVPSSAPPVPPSAAQPSQTLGRWRQYVQGELGSVPLPGSTQPPQPLVQRIQDVGDLIAVEEAFADNPQRLAQLRADKMRLEAELAAQESAPQTIPAQPSATPPPLPQGEPSALAPPPPALLPPAPPGMPQAPSPPPYSRVGNRLPTLREGAQGLSIQTLRDDHGRWKIPLKELPSAELELQDFIRQQGGIRLAGETDVPGELRALITRKETGTYGLHNDASGKTLETMAEAAAEAAFIPTADKISLLEALDRSVNQNKSMYSMNATGWVPVLHDPGLLASYDALLTLAETFKGRVAVQRRADQGTGTRPRATVHEEARQLLESGQWTQADLQEILPGTALNDTMASVVVQQLGIMTDGLFAAAAKAMALPESQLLGSPESKSFRQHLALLAEVDPQRLGVIAEAGRSLGILNDPLSPINRRLKYLDELIPQSVDMTERQLMRKLLAFKDQDGAALALAQAAKDLAHPGFKGFFLEAWINGMLGPKTLLANAVGGVGVPPLRIIETFLGGLISQTPGIGSGEMHPRNALSMVQALPAGIADGWVLMGKAFAADQEQFQQHYGLEDLGTGRKDDLEYPKAWTAKNVGLNPDTPIGKMMDFWFEYLGPIVPAGGRLSTRLMMTTDEFAKGVNFRIELAALADMEAYQLGLTGAAAQQYRLEAVTRPSAEQLRQAAGRQTILNVFQQEITDDRGVAKAFKGLADMTINVAGLFELPLGRILIPFVRTPANLARFALERTPLAPLFANVAHDLTSGPSAARDMAMGRMLLGTMTSMAIASLVGQGFITGRGPEDPRLKEALENTGWRPYSLHVGESYIPYDRFDPFAMILGITADVVQSQRDSNDPMVERLGAGVVYALSRNLTSRTYMQGLARFFDAMTPKSYTKPEDLLKGVTNLFRGTAGSFVPWTAVTMERWMDPYQREMNQTLDGVYSRMPGWSESLPYDRNKWGEPRLLGWGFGPDWVTRMGAALSPMAVSQEKDSPIDAELSRQQIRLGMPAKILPLELQDGTRNVRELQHQDPNAADKLDLTPEQYDRYLLFAAANQVELNMLPDRPRYDYEALKHVTTAVGLRLSAMAGKTVAPPADAMSLKAVLDWAVGTYEYDSLQTFMGPGGAKQDFLEWVDRQYRTAGFAQLLAHDPALKQKVDLAKIQRQYLRTPAERQPDVLRLFEQQRPTVGATP